MRPHFLGKSAASLGVVGLTPMLSAKPKLWWCLLVKRGLSAMMIDTPKAACVRTAQFMEWPGDMVLTIVLGPDIASSHFWEKAPMHKLKPGSPKGPLGVDIWSDEEKARQDADWRLDAVI